MRWLKVLLAVLLLSSCRTYEPVAPVSPKMPPQKVQSLRIEVTPQWMLMAPGVVDYVYVTVLDEEGNPLANKEIRVVMDNPAVATLDKECKITDASGKAVFALTGIAFPEITTLTFHIDGVSCSIVVDGFSASIS